MQCLQLILILKRNIQDHGEDWGDTEPICMGNHQSPINLPADPVAEPPPTKFITEDFNGGLNLMAQNNGYSIQLNIKNLTDNR